MLRLLHLIVLAITVFGCASAAPGTSTSGARAREGRAQSRRPLPYLVAPPVDFQQAIERGTRTESGEPGPRYWQQWADYRLSARLDPAAKRLEGRGEIVYANNSPDTLAELHLELSQNIHADGAPRIVTQEVTGGIELKRVQVDGQELSRPSAGPPPGAPAPAQGAPGPAGAPRGPAGAPPGPRYEVSGTRLRIVPPSAVPPGGKVRLVFDWAFAIPQAGADGRMGWSGGNLLFLAYWYPQMAVYDDVIGWHQDPFLGRAEFYAGFGSYDVVVETPPGWVVIATGALRNAADVLAEPVLDRLRRAEASDEVVHVLTAEDFGPRSTRPARSGGHLSWHFRADSVRDFAFSATRESYWDAARTAVGDRDGDGKTDYARVDALYRELAPRWRSVARYAQHAIAFLSKFTGLPYPWPHMSAVEGSGIITGGMEFPMMTLIGDYNARGDSALYYVTAHELAHMWVPMIVSNNERRYGWLDEGTTTFHENQARLDFFPGSNPAAADREAYVQLALSGREGEMMRWSDFQYSRVEFEIASYEKPASVLAALRAVLGEDTFLRAYHAFLRRWAFKHPYPWDLFNTFDSLSGRDLDWFWRSWYYETWTLDQAVGSVTPREEGTRILVEDRGLLPMPARLTISLAGGETLEREVPVETWLAGTRSAVVTVPPGPSVERVEIDAAHLFPDVDRENNVWSR